MISLNIISTTFTVLTLGVILFLCFLDYCKKRNIKENPFLSFLIPCYNDGGTIEKTIKSIYACYDPRKFEIIIVDDKSKDNSLAILKKLQKKYDFRLVENEKNIGKSQSLNDISKFAKSDILFFIDADIILNKRSVNDLLARMQSRPNLMAVSCPYTTKCPGFIPKMQILDFNMFSLLQASYNPSSTISLWGGCMLIKKAAFEKVNGFSVNMLCEDLDLAFKINEKGWKVEQSLCPVITYVPKSIKTWYRQKLRWSGGGIQCLIKHFKVYISHPLQAFFLISYSLITLISAIFLIKEIVMVENIWGSYEFLRQTTGALLSLKLLGISYGAALFNGIISRISFSFLALPYVIPSIKRFKDIYKMLYVIPFSLVYYPIFSLISLVGFVKGVRAHYKYKGGQRAW